MIQGLVSPIVSRELAISMTWMGWRTKRRKDSALEVTAGSQSDGISQRTTPVRVTLRRMRTRMRLENAGTMVVWGEALGRLRLPQTSVRPQPQLSDR